jgi:hypothetical protein
LRTSPLLWVTTHVPSASFGLVMRSRLVPANLLAILFLIDGNRPMRVSNPALNGLLPINAAGSRYPGVEAR